MSVDSYAYLPRAFRSMFESAPQFDHEPIITPLSKPLTEARIGLLSSAGIFTEGQAPFDVDRERQEPTWGDPSLRLIPNDVSQSQIDARHLHIETADLLIDMNISLPIHRLDELATDGAIGNAAPMHFSVMGFQAEGADVWRTRTAPEIAARCHADDIDALILAPA